MNMTNSQITKVIGEIKEPLIGSFADKFIQTASETFIISFRKSGKRYHLLISGSPVNGRIHLVSKLPENKAELLSFGAIAKKVINRAYLSSIEQINHDRIVAITFETSSGQRKLFIELMGTRGEIYLTDGDQVVLARFFGRKRSFHPSEKYEPPKPPENSAPLDEKSKPEGSGPLAWNRHYEKLYEPLAKSEVIDRLKSVASAPIKVELKKLSKRASRINGEQKKLLTHVDDKKLADLLQANYQKLVKGESEITVVDMFDENQSEATIPLNPALNPTENVARYYKNHRRYEKGIPRLEQELREVANKESVLKDKLKNIEDAIDEKGLKPFLPKESNDKKKSNSAKTKLKKKSSVPGRKYVSSEGFDVYVGRNDRENDELSVKVAKGSDLWLHVRDYPGSHVVVRLPKGAPLPQISLREAAMVAIRYSKLSKSGQGDVTWCYAKNVRKPKGLAPGKVLVAGGKSISVTINKETLEAMKKRAEE